MEYSTIQVTQEGAVSIITLNRPQSLNALDDAMCREILAALDKIHFDKSARAALLKGSGRAFCAGGDVKGMRDSLEGRSAQFLKDLTLLFHAVVSAMRRLPKPIVGAVQGFAAGAGFSLALACDMLVAAEDARFNLAYANIGLNPDGGSTYFLPRLFPWQKLMEAVFTARFIPAAEALEWGMLNRVVPAGELEPTAMELAQQLAAGPTFAFAQAKALLAESLSHTLEYQMEEERQRLAQSARTKDFAEGIRAFFEKRKPQFIGE